MPTQSVQRRGASKIKASNFASEISNIVTRAHTGPFLAGVVYGADSGNQTYGGGGTFSGTSAVTFDSNYFKVSGSTLVCQQACTVSVRALTRHPDGAWTYCNAGSSSIGGGRVYGTDWNEEMTVSMTKGQTVSGAWQVASDRANAGGCFLVYFK